LASGFNGIPVGLLSSAPVPFRHPIQGHHSHRFGLILNEFLPDGSLFIRGVSSGTGGRPSAFPSWPRNDTADMCNCVRDYEYKSKEMIPMDLGGDMELPSKWNKRNGLINPPRLSPLRRALANRPTQLRCRM